MSGYIWTALRRKRVGAFAAQLEATVRAAVRGGVPAATIRVQPVHAR